MLRRVDLKRRDDPRITRVVLVVALTVRNRGPSTRRGHDPAGYPWTREGLSRGARRLGMLPLDGVAVVQTAAAGG